MYKKQLKPVARYRNEYNIILNIDLPCTDIYISDGLHKHILKRHPDCISYINRVDDILLNPDYIGENPKEKNSIEFVKCYSENILVAVKLDIKDEYLYVASVYDITDSKLQRRIKSKRLIKTAVDKSDIL